MFDEADLLLCGSFQNQVIRLINMLRFDEKLLSRSKASLCEETNKLNPDTQLFDYENEDGMHNLILVEEGETEKLL